MIRRFMFEFKNTEVGIGRKVTVITLGDLMKPRLWREVMVCSSRIRG